MPKFHKYTGAGNDFLIFEDLDRSFPIKEIPRICDRHMGVGADGLILWHDHSTADAEMSFFNADGNQASMCGNGLRCFVHFLRDHAFSKALYTISISDHIVQVKSLPSSISTFLPYPRILFWEKEIEGMTLYGVDVGVPHVVCFPKGPIDVETLGRKLRFSLTLFQIIEMGANINFAWVEGPLRWRVRTYERGVEGETQACGTGAVATAFVTKELGGLAGDIAIVTRSNQLLKVHFTEDSKEPGLETPGVEVVGPSQKVFEGWVDI